METTRTSRISLQFVNQINVQSLVDFKIHVGVNKADAKGLAFRAQSKKGWDFQVLTK